MNLSKWQRVVISVGVLALIILASNPPVVLSAQTCRWVTNIPESIMDLFIIVSSTAAVVWMIGKESKP